MSSSSIKGIIGVSQSVTGALNNTIVRSSGGGTGDYLELSNKPKINGVSLQGDKSLDELGIQAKGEYANKSDIPTKTSQLSNDSSYITSIPSEYVTESELNKAIANLTGGSSDNNFSSEEQIIGTWFGKPLYRKTLTTVVEGNSQGSISLSNLNYDQIWINQGKSFNQYDGNNTSSAINWVSNINNDYGIVYINVGKNVMIRNNSSQTRQYYITLEYTKTTD